MGCCGIEFTVFARRAFLPFNRRFARVAILTALLAPLALSGCATDTGGATRSAEARPEAVLKQARVLYRMDIHIGDKRASPESFWGNGVRLYLANLDKQEPVRRVSNLGQLPGATGEDGWASMMLEPGTYFFLVVPPGAEQNPPAVAFHTVTARFGRLRTYKLEPARGGVADPGSATIAFHGAVPNDFEPIAGFLLQVPEGWPLVYAGTLRIRCTTGRGVFGDLIGECSDTGVSDETTAAQSVAGTLGAGESELRASLLSRYGRAMAPLDVRGTGLEAVAVPPPKDTTGIDFSPHAVGPPLIVMGSHPAIGIFNLLSLAGQQAGIAASQSEAQAQAEKWRPCMERLAAEVHSLNLIALVTSANASALAPLRSAAPGQPRPSDPSGAGAPRYDYVLGVAAQPHQLRLRECVKRSTFCLELAMRVQLSDLVAKRKIFDAELVYSNAWPPSDFQRTSYRLYQIPTRARSECRVLETWCSDGSVELLRKEAAAGVDAIMRTVVERAEPH